MNNVGFEIDWSCTEAIDNSGIEEGALTNEISLFPNPTQDNVTINAVYSLDAILEIYDLIGRTLLETPITGYSQELNFNNWCEKGVYLIRIKERNSDKVIASERVVVH